MLLNEEIRREASPLELMRDLPGTFKIKEKGGELVCHWTEPGNHNSDLDLMGSTRSTCSTGLLSRQKPVCLGNKFKPSHLGWEIGWCFLSQRSPSFWLAGRSALGTVAPSSTVSMASPNSLSIRVQWRVVVCGHLHWGGMRRDEGSDLRHQEQRLAQKGITFFGFSYIKQRAAFGSCASVFQMLYTGLRQEV